MQTTTVAPKPRSAPCDLYGQVSQIMAWPPISSGMTGMTKPASRSRRTTSWVAMAMAAATSGIHRIFLHIKIAMMLPPMAAPTRIATGRLRPARDFFGFSFAGPCTDPSAGVFAPVSVSATDIVAERPLDLQQLAFFVFDQVIDLGHVLMRGLVQVLLRPRDLVFTGFAILADAVELLHCLAADIAHRDPGVLALGFGLLDEFAPAFFGQLWHRHPDQRAVVGRVHTQLGVADGRLDGPELACLVRLDDDQARFW